MRRSLLEVMNLLEGHNIKRICPILQLRDRSAARRAIYSSKNRRMSSSKLGLDFTSHSHTSRTFHPIACSSPLCLASRSWFRSLLSVQKTVFDLGSRVPTGQECPCQKHPLTKMTFFLPENTRSGLPGNRLSCSRYLKPALWRSLRSASSGFVFADFILDMWTLRCSGLIKSTMHLSYLEQTITRRACLRWYTYVQDN